MSIPHFLEIEVIKNLYTKIDHWLLLLRGTSQLDICYFRNHMGILVISRNKYSWTV